MGWRITAECCLKTDISGNPHCFLTQCPHNPEASRTEGNIWQPCQHALCPACHRSQWIYLYRSLFLCVRCVLSSCTERTQKKKIVAIGVTSTILLGVMVVGLMLFIYRHHKKIKQFLQPPLRLPDHYCEVLPVRVFPQQALSLTTSPCEDRHDIISIICLEEDLIPESDREQDYDLPNGLDFLDHYE
uniref:Uncharacterized protein n=1 Tax=Oncorhynchus tshawytscha TaxID=74940 RepID=A0AAZ3PSW4_ONCTS